MKNLRTPEMTKNCDISNFQAFPIPDLQKVGFVEYHFFFWHLGRPRNSENLENTENSENQDNSENPLKFRFF